MAIQTSIPYSAFSITKESPYLDNDFKDILFKREPISEDVSDSLFDVVKKEVCSQLISQFGLSQIYDNFKDGGNVTTLHNAKKGVFSDEQIEERFERPYDQNLRKEIYEKDFPKKRKALLKKEATILDGYTRKELKKDGRTHLDHVVSASEIQGMDKARLYMTDEKRGEMAVNSKNLTLTEGSLNQSKGDKDVVDFMNASNKKEPSKTNAEFYGMDKETTQKVHKEATDSINKNIKKEEKAYYKEQIKSTSVSQGLAMAKKQAIGVLIYEFTNQFTLFAKEYTKKWKSFNSMEERITAFKCGVENTLKNIKERALKIFSNMISGFINGFISGVFSNIITIMINTFATTSKSIAKILNDGVHGIIQAINILRKRPTSMSKEQAAKEAVKLISTAVVVSIGAILTEAFSSYLKTTPFAPFADIIASVIGTLLTATVSALLIYCIDNFGKIIAKMGESFKELSFTLNISQRQIIERYETLSTRIDDIYQKILERILKEYEELNKLTELAYDFQMVASVQFGYSIDYARKMNVPDNKILKSIDEIDSYFLD